MTYLEKIADITEDLYISAQEMVKHEQSCQICLNEGFCADIVVKGQEYEETLTKLRNLHHFGK